MYTDCKKDSLPQVMLTLKFQLADVHGLQVEEGGEKIL